MKARRDDIGFFCAGEGEIILLGRDIDSARTNGLPADLIASAISRVELPSKGRSLRATIDLGCHIGMESCVEIGAWEEQYFALRFGTHHPVRVVTDILPQPTTCVTIYARRTNDWVLQACHLGPSTPRLPHDQHFKNTPNSDSFRESWLFWHNHALVYDPVRMGQPFVSTWEREVEMASRIYQAMKQISTPKQ